jgi:hypothetical protein
MALYLPRLRVQLDPLIAEAKRRARRRRFLVAAAVALAAVGVGTLAQWELSGANASAASFTSGTQCAGPSSYGLQCIDLRGSVRGSGVRVERMQTWNWEVAALTPVKWRMDLQRYGCDPIGQAKWMCSAAKTWHGRARTGVPIVGRRALTPHLVQSRSHRYWPTFAIPHTFRSSANVWLCTELAIYNPVRHRWIYNARGLPDGLRACVSAHA